MKVILDKELIKYTSFKTDVAISGRTLDEVIVGLANEFPQLYAFLMCNDRKEADKTALKLNGEYLEDASCLWLKVSDEDTLEFTRDVPEGASAVGKMIVGAVLMISSIWLGPIAFSMGLSLALGGLGEMIAGTPNLPTDGNSTSSTYTFSGIHNTTVSGTPIPLIYGRHRTGGQLLNAYVDNSAGLVLDQTNLSVTNSMLYAQFGLSEGEIECIEKNSVEINQRYAADYDDVSAFWRSGEPTPTAGGNGVLFATSSSTTDTTPMNNAMEWTLTGTGSIDAVVYTGEVNNINVTLPVYYYSASMTLESVTSVSAVDFVSWGMPDGATATPVDANGVRLGDSITIYNPWGFMGSVYGPAFYVTNKFILDHPFTGSITFNFTYSITGADTAHNEFTTPTPGPGISNIISFTLYNDSLGIVDSDSVMSGFNRINNSTSYNIFIPNKPTASPYTLEDDNIGAIVSTTTAVDTAVITISAPMLYTKSGSAGALVPLEFYYRKTFADHSTISDNWTEFTPETPLTYWNALYTKNATKSATTLTVTMNFPSVDFYDVKVIRSASSVENDSDITTANSAYLTILNEVTYDDLVYPCTALLGIRAKATAQLSGNLPTITSIVQGIKVAVPTGYYSVYDSARGRGVRRQIVPWYGTLTTEATQVASTGNTTGNNTINISSAEGFIVGQPVTIGGFKGKFIITGISGANITVDRAIGVQLTGATVVQETKMWTDNPVWCLYDLITNPRYGMGQEFQILPSRKGMMLANFYTMAQYCDEYILTDGSVVTYRTEATQVTLNSYATINNDGYLYKCTTAGTTSNGSISGVSISKDNPPVVSNTVITDGSVTWTYVGPDTSTPRFSLNIVIDQQKSAREWINTICASMRATLFNCEGVVLLDIDRPKSITQLFNTSNITNYTQSSVSFKGIPNVYQVQFPNKDKDFTTDAFTVETYGYQQDSTQVQILQNVNLIGVTNINDAQKLAAYMLAKQQSSITTVSFKTGTDSLLSTVTDVIGIQHDVPMWGSGGRITTVEENILTLSAPFDYALSNTGDGSLYGSLSIAVSQQGQPPVTVQVVSPATAGSYDSVTVVPQDGFSPSSGDVYVLNFTTNTVKPFTIINLQRDSDEFVTVTAIEYNEEIFNDSIQINTIAKSNYSTLPVSRKTSVSGFKVETYNSTDGLGKATVGVNIWYDVPGNILWKGLQVAYQLQGSTAYSYTAVDTTGNIQIPNLPEGTYVFIGVSQWKDGGAQTISECLADATYQPYSTLSVAAVIPNNFFLTSCVTGLETVGYNDGTFIGKDCKVTWRPVVVSDQSLNSTADDTSAGSSQADLVSYYIITITNLDGSTRRVDKTSNESYVYTHEFNAQDGTVARYFRIYVVAVDVNGNKNLPASLLCSNPAPQAMV